MFQAALTFGFVVGFTVDIQFKRDFMDCSYARSTAFNQRS
jgi:hypothetical protein